MLQPLQNFRDNVEINLGAFNKMDFNYKIIGAGKLYTLLGHIHDKFGLKTKLFVEDDPIESGVLYMCSGQVKLATVL